MVIGSKIIDFRRIFSEQLSKLIENIYCKLVVNNEKLQLTYQPNIKLAKNNKTADLFWRALKKVSDKEIQRGISLVGPHRDDFCFKINEKEIKKFGSRGQHKTVLFSLAAAEYSLIKKLTSETPIILIDDLY